MAKKILIVDDSKAIRQSIRFVLEQNEYQVLDAEDGLDALEKLRNETVDLIITDVNMPNMNGIELIQELRGKEGFRFVPILVLTTESQNSVMEKGKAAGATGWIVKPFSTDKLLAAVRKVVG
ncbi:response regulator [Marispirochaeta sp.]|jgi:two-component system, chemotaxis family, chemotaxis protein CheY|uniref:response regulator n=1 Tax=Marispirochaeta sp. TaxID=2038653 RepID=UPI0029C8FA7C|nr:response regulator [Marispirochaeta sp.]